MQFIIKSSSAYFRQSGNDCVSRGINFDGKTEVDLNITTNISWFRDLSTQVQYMYRFKSCFYSLQNWSRGLTHLCLGRPPQLKSTLMVNNCTLTEINSKLISNMWRLSTQIQIIDYMALRGLSWHLLMVVGSWLGQGTCQVWTKQSNTKLRQRNIRSVAKVGLLSIFFIFHFQSIKVNFYWL